MKKSPVHCIKKSGEFFTIIFILFFTSALLTGCDYFFPPLSGDKISPAEAEKFLAKNKDNEDVKLIDLNTRPEFDSLHIEGSTNLDFSMPDFPELVQKLDKDKRYILVDMTGKKSSMAFQLFKEENFSKVHWIEGGLSEWQKQGFKTINR